MHKRREVQFWFAFLILPLINITALFLADPLQENITHIAYASHQLPFVICWSISCAWYFYTYTFQLMKHFRYEKKTGKRCLRYSCLGMVLSVCIPYHVEQADLLSKLHVNLAMGSTLVYILIILHILYHSYFQHMTLIPHLVTYYLTLIGSLAMLFLLMGSVCTVLESSFVIGMGVFLYVANKKAACAALS